ncbi:MAG: 3-deoxy-D-manno-octulosonate 8-phosphate phosphatase (KDO 8-P phosphatase) [Oleiphilaceae bacterium]|jgi:3-deoxy-D-manno-octulosonate 8-phosphate phosphatase (KDO 8-P phosphatase)
MQTIIEKAKKIQLLVLDVDGVMTDGKVYFSAQGDELKAFSILDGQGIKTLLKNNIQVAIITGRTSPLTARRARDLGIDFILQGREDKKIALQELSDELNIVFDNIAYVGDDLPDLSAIISSGLGVTVPNGHFFVKQHADYCTNLAGGQGAVREVCDLILDAQALLESTHKAYLN